MQVDSHLMTPSEQLILQAIHETSREICRVITKMWASGVHAGLDSRLNSKELPDIGKVIDLMNSWSDDVSRLMTWLDWSVWVKCKPACGPEEMCHLPTWPVGFLWPKPKRRRPEDSDSSSGTLSSAHQDFRTLAIKSIVAVQVEGWNDMTPEPDEWIKLHPKCIRRVQPLRVLIIYVGYVVSLLAFVSYCPASSFLVLAPMLEVVRPFRICPR
ncbi:hypothetical protein BS17DRAFT_121372 [Gyrodon lividus]|nr:hypothetical protein BS17DRAFT_121372 [Gyrodon lividus]